MAKVVLRQEAIDDLNMIWEYTFEKWSETQADRYYATIRLACTGIGDNPEDWVIYKSVKENGQYKSIDRMGKEIWGRTLAERVNGILISV